MTVQKRMITARHNGNPAIVYRIEGYNEENDFLIRSAPLDHVRIRTIQMDHLGECIIDFQEYRLGDGIYEIIDPRTGRYFFYVAGSGEYGIRVNEGEVIGLLEYHTKYSPSIELKLNDKVLESYYVVNDGIITEIHIVHHIKYSKSLYSVIMKVGDSQKHISENRSRKRAIREMREIIRDISPYDW